MKPTIKHFITYLIIVGVISKIILVWERSILNKFYYITNKRNEQKIILIYNLSNNNIAFFDILMNIR